MSPRELSRRLIKINPKLSFKAYNAPGEGDSFYFYFDNRQICAYYADWNFGERMCTAEFNGTVGLEEFDDWFIPFLKLIKEYSKYRKG